MATKHALDAEAYTTQVMRILDDNRTMAVATLRPDGWPQATIVSFIHEGLMLYFVVARSSQKLANLQRDKRVSIAIGSADPVRGLSAAARVQEVMDPDEINRLNVLLQSRYPATSLFAPRSSNCAILRATPTVISLVDEAEGVTQPVLLEVATRTELKLAG